MAPTKRPTRADAPAAPARKSSRKAARSASKGKPAGEAARRDQTSKAEAALPQSLEGERVEARDAWEVFRDAREAHRRRLQRAMEAPVPRPAPPRGKALIGAQILALLRCDEVRGGWTSFHSSELDRAFPGFLADQVRAKIDLARCGVFEVRRVINWARWDLDPEYLGEPIALEDESGAGGGFDCLLRLSPAVSRAIEEMPPDQASDPEVVAGVALLAAKDGEPRGESRVGETDRLILAVILRQQQQEPRGRWNARKVVDLLAVHGESVASRLGMAHRVVSEDHCLRRLRELEGAGLLSREGERRGWFIASDQLPRVREVVGAGCDGRG